MLQDRLEQLKGLVEDNGAYLIADTMFHRNIVLSTGNNELIELFHQMQRKYGLGFNNFNLAVHDTPNFAKEHHALNERLYQALVSGTRAELDIISTEHNEQFLAASCTWLSYDQP